MDIAIRKDFHEIVSFLQKPPPIPGRAPREERERSKSRSRTKREKTDSGASSKDSGRRSTKPKERKRVILSPIVHSSKIISAILANSKETPLYTSDFLPLQLMIDGINICTGENRIFQNYPHTHMMTGAISRGTLHIKAHQLESNMNPRFDINTIVGALKESSIDESELK